MSEDTPRLDDGLRDDDVPNEAQSIKDRSTRAESPDGSHDDESTDARLARVLRGESSSEALRHTLTGERSEESEDLLARLDALDFVHQVCGGTTGIPQRIAEYEIKGLLGRGGMGTVYLGYQQELEREVALKVLAPSYSADPTMRKRFRAEARATAALHHRHIVPIYDYGEAQGMLFFTMERVDGMSLDKHISSARRLKRQAMTPLDAARRFAGVADALGLAHRRRLLHRDVKPGNILVAEDGTLALTDFGLAKTLDQVSAALTSKDGGFLGTLYYASPEQALGDDLTPASDLYSLGVTIFEAVTGQLPFAVKTTEALLAAILHGTPRRLRELMPKVPRDFDAVVEKLLSREPSDRYQDGEALSRDLLRIRDGEPVHIRRLPLHTRIYRRARKNPGLSGAIAAACVLLLVTVVLLTVWRREKGQSLASRHQNHLVQIATDIGNEFGSPSGPVPLLQCLTGATFANPAPNNSVMRSLMLAHDELPDDEHVAEMQRAYVDDPLPRASELLAQGAGREAMAHFTRAIDDATAIRTGGELDLAVELRLYRIYLGRAVANLTMSVARVNAARTDLALASYLRPGAAFPRCLVDVLDVADSKDVIGDANELEADLERAAPERVAVTGHLLWSIARLRPVARCNLMNFGLTYPQRRYLHDLALRLLPAPPEPVLVAGQPTGLDGEIAAMMRGMIDLLEDPSALLVEAERVRKTIRQKAHPDSPLGGWSGALQLIEQPEQRGHLVDATGRPLSPVLQLAGWQALLRMQPPRELAALLLPRFEELYRRHPNLSGMLQVAARFHLLSNSPFAPDMVQAWISAAEGDPEAQLWRMRVRLSDGDFKGAMDDAMVAVQESVTPEESVAEVIRLCDEALGTAGPLNYASIFGLQSAFKLYQAELEQSQSGGGR